MYSICFDDNEYSVYEGSYSNYNAPKSGEKESLNIYRIGDLPKESEWNKYNLYFQPGLDSSDKLWVNLYLRYLALRNDVVKRVTANGKTLLFYYSGGHVKDRNFERSSQYAQYIPKLEDTIIRHDEINSRKYGKSQNSFTNEAKWDKDYMNSFKIFDVITSVFPDSIEQYVEGSNKMLKLDVYHKKTPFIVPILIFNNLAYDKNQYIISAKTFMVDNIETSSFLNDPIRIKKYPPQFRVAFENKKNMDGIMDKNELNELYSFINETEKPHKAIKDEIKGIIDYFIDDEYSKYIDYETVKFEQNEYSYELEGNMLIPKAELDYDGDIAQRMLDIHLKYYNVIEGQHKDTVNFDIVNKNSDDEDDIFWNVAFIARHTLSI